MNARELVLVLGEPACVEGQACREEVVVVVLGEHRGFSHVADQVLEEGANDDVHDLGED